MHTHSTGIIIVDLLLRPDDDDDDVITQSAMMKTRSELSTIYCLNGVYLFKILLQRVSSSLIQRIATGLHLFRRVSSFLHSLCHLFLISFLRLLFLLLVFFSFLFYRIGESHFYTSKLSLVLQLLFLRFSLLFPFCSLN